MDFTPEQISAFRYWIQGYPNFYEPIVEEYFKVAGYRVLRRPALVHKRDIQHILNALFDGCQHLGTELDATGCSKSLAAATGAEAAALRELTTNWRTLIEERRGGLW